MSLFTLHVPFDPAGDQQKAIEQLANHSNKRSTLLGVTGSGKTFTIANVIAKQNKPVVVLAPNKTLAAQLYEEFSLFFPNNKVCYFVSYYDYYQPESYLPAQDMYIPKETKINAEIERLRIETVASIMQRRDVIIIASVSCIYSLGSPQQYREQSLPLAVGDTIKRADLARSLIGMHYDRNEINRKSGTFQLLGERVEVQVPYEKHTKLRIDLCGDRIESLAWVDTKNNTLDQQVQDVVIFPAKPFAASEQTTKQALKMIKQELEAYLPTMHSEVYRQRLERRVLHDIEMIEETGFCSGIENYSIFFDGRQTGQAPYCLFDFFKKDDFLLIIDESHITIPQLHAMYHGDLVRKKSLVEFGFRLPCAFDNRPLKFQEIEQFFINVIFVSATPGNYELTHSTNIVEQIIRPTGLLDPVVDLHGRLHQMQNLYEQITSTTSKGFRSLVTVLTKRMAEELAVYLQEKGIKVCYLHSDLKTPKRTELLQKLRAGVFDCLVGVNLLREGLDLPEVAFVAIMDADVPGFLRDKRSLIQIIGRAARNTQSLVRLYADTITDAMQAAMQETSRRRILQEAYNKEHAIIPQTVKREVTKSIMMTDLASQTLDGAMKKTKQDTLEQLEEKMRKAAADLDFQTAIALREQMYKLKKKL